MTKNTADKFNEIFAAHTRYLDPATLHLERVSKAQAASETAGKRDRKALLKGLTATERHYLAAVAHRLAFIVERATA